MHAVTLSRAGPAAPAAESAVDRKRRLARARQRRRRARLRADREAVAPRPLIEPPPADLDLIPWIERLTVPTGPLTGQPFTLGEWQRDFLAGALNDGIFEAGLSVPRKNGKSGLVAALCLAGVCGPLNRPNWQAIVTSLTGALGLISMVPHRRTTAAAFRQVVRESSVMGGTHKRRPHDRYRGGD